MKTTIYLVEDDPNLGFLIQDHLEMNEYIVIRRTDGQQAIDEFDPSADICVVDVMMPKLDGFGFVSELRNQGVNVPVIFLTAKALKEDRIQGFKVGGDDYLTKPFSMEELLLRIEAILRRSGASETVRIHKLGAFTFDATRNVLTHGLDEIRLTHKEAGLLAVLCQNRNQISSREAMLKAVWGDDSYYNSRSMDVYISKLRKILSSDEWVEIVSVHGEGYKLVVRTPES